MGDYLSMHPHDRQQIEELRAYRAEACSGCGVHPALWRKDMGGDPNGIRWDWEKCRVCELRAIAEENPPKDDTGNPLKGYHLVMHRVSH